MTIKEAKERIERMYHQGLITTKERDRRMNDPNILEEMTKEIEISKKAYEEAMNRIAEIEARNTMLISKEIGIIKVGDLVRLDPLFMESDVLGLVVEVRKTKRMSFLYVEWTGETPQHSEISDRLGTKEYYFIKA